MIIKTNVLDKASLPEELLTVLESVAYEFGDVMEDLETLKITPLKGAMTNKVYKISWPTKNYHLLRKVLVRLYGEGVEVFFKRDDEIRTFESLSNYGQGPRLLGKFKAGRVEEFIHARTLSAVDLRIPEISSLVATKLRQFHNIDIPGSKSVILWNRLRSWISKAKNYCSIKESEEFYLDILENEVNMLKNELFHDHQEIGFCHNDLQYGNIMMDEETRSLILIDYEYASYNPVAYDIANHFCEMVANYHSETPHILDYSKYPDLEERWRFAQAYLTSAGDQPNDKEVDQLVMDAEKYTLANHIFWGLWGVISAHVNKIDFDYKEYARQRFKQYWLTKPAFLDSTSILT